MSYNFYVVNLDYNCKRRVQVITRKLSALMIDTLSTTAFPTSGSLQLLDKQKVTV